MVCVCGGLWVHAYPSSTVYLSKFVTIGKRLREEREKLGLNQTDFAAIGGVGRKSQFNYEDDERRADTAYLAAIAAAGADVRYIITGERDAPPPEVLSTAEQMLVENFRRCGKEAQANLLQSSTLLAAGIGGTAQVTTTKVKKAKGVVIGTNHGVSINEVDLGKGESNK